MSYQSSLIKDQRIVKISHSGLVNYHEMEFGKDMAFMYLSQLGWNKLLLNLRDADLQFDATEVATLFKNIGDTFPDDAFLAVVRPRQMAFDYCRYAQSTASAWANTKVEIFTQEDLATGWLTEH